MTSVKWTDSVAPLRERNFRWFFASRFVNTFGGVMANIALAFAVLEITDSATALGQVLAAHTIPVVIFLLGGGVIADRFPRAVVLQVSNVVSGALQGAIALLVITGTAEIWMLVVLTAIQGVASAVAFPAMASIMPQLVPREQLQQANALNSLMRGSLNILGPTVGALLVVTVGAGWALMADALTWFVAALLLLPVRIPPRPARTEESPSAIAELREGWSYFWQTHLAVGRGDRLLLPQRHPLRGDLHPRPDGGAGDVRRAGLGAGALGGVGRPDPDDDRDAARPAPAAAAARDARDLGARPADPDAGRASRARSS